MKALVVNCTLKASPEKSNTEALAEVVADALRQEDVEVASVRAVDHSIPPGVESEMVEPEQAIAHGRELAEQGADAGAAFGMIRAR